MDIKIKEPVPLAPRQYKSVFVVESRFMHGDADAYTTDDTELADFDELHMFIQLADAWFAMPWNKRCDMCTTAEGMFGLPNYIQLFTTGETVEELLSGWGEEYWPRDMVYGQNRKAKLDSYTVFWYDKDGTKHLVELIREGDEDGI